MTGLYQHTKSEFSRLYRQPAVKAVLWYRSDSDSQYTVRKSRPGTPKPASSECPCRVPVADWGRMCKSPVGCMRRLIRKGPHARLVKLRRSVEAPQGAVEPHWGGGVKTETLGCGCQIVARAISQSSSGLSEASSDPIASVSTLQSRCCGGRHKTSATVIAGVRCLDTARPEWNPAAQAATASGAVAGAVPCDMSADSSFRASCRCVVGAPPLLAACCCTARSPSSTTQRNASASWHTDTEESGIRFRPRCRRW